MSQILVEESALDSIKAMARKLQEERDELLEQMERAAIACAHHESIVAKNILLHAIKNRHSSPKVME